MRALSAPELLDVWELGLSSTPIQRVVTLLAAVWREPPDAIAQLSVGQRDTRLLLLRERLFGSQVVCVATCPVCGERLELNFTTADVRQGTDTESEDALSVNVDGYVLRFRLPNSLDQIAIADCPDAHAARQRLLERCLATGELHGETVAVCELPTEVVDAVAQRMAQADPQGDVQLALVCPRCNHRWEAGFDVSAFLWSEITAWAHRILGDVQSLAAAYGWREADILTMSAWRRQFYLNGIGR
jgi:hypothetical protein